MWQSSFPFELIWCRFLDVDFFSSIISIYQTKFWKKDIKRWKILHVIRFWNTEVTFVKPCIIRTTLFNFLSDWFLFLSLLCLDVRHCNINSFLSKGDILYDLRCRFAVEGYGISILSIYFHLNKMTSFLLFFN